MLKLKLARPMLVALAACAASVALNSVVFADDAQTQALKDQMRIMQQQMQQLQNQIDTLSTKQAAGPPKSAASSPEKGKVAMTPLETKFDNFLKGFYGSLGVSVDYTTKGMNNPNAYNYYYANGAPGSPYVITSGPKAGTVRARRLAGSHVEQRIQHRVPRLAQDPQLGRELHLSGVDRHRHGGGTRSAQ